MNDIVYSCVSNYYKGRNLDKEDFARRLRYVKRIVNKEMTYKDAVGWIIVHEQSELFCENEDELNEAKKQCTKELKTIVKNVKKAVDEISTN